MINFLIGILIDIILAFHDALYSKIRKESYELYPDKDQIADWSLYAKFIKFALFIAITFSYQYYGDLTVIGFWISRCVAFDQLHSYFAWGHFMNWTQYLDRHIIHRIWQWQKRHAKFEQFQWKEWNHEYLGWLMLGTGLPLYFFTEMTKTGSALIAFGTLITIDGIYQLYAGQDKGPMHTLYIRTVYKWGWVKSFNDFMDKLFGKGKEDAKI